jgi:thioredoxin 1
MFLFVFIFFTCSFTINSSDVSLCDPAFAAKKAPKAITTQKTKNKSTKNIMDLDLALKANVPVVLKLGADSCPPCRAMKPIMKDLAIEQDGKIIFLDLDIYKHRELAKQFSVRLIPTIVFFDSKGQVISKAEGAMNKQQLLKAVADLKLKK